MFCMLSSFALIFPHHLSCLSFVVKLQLIYSSQTHFNECSNVHILPVCVDLYVCNPGQDFLKLISIFFYPIFLDVDVNVMI